MGWHHENFHRGVPENSCGDASEDVGLVLGTSVSTHNDQVTSQFVSYVDDVRCSLPPCNRSTHLSDACVLRALDDPIDNRVCF
jgi:hypothetical protein